MDRTQNEIPGVPDRWLSAPRRLDNGHAVGPECGVESPPQKPDGAEFRIHS